MSLEVYSLIILGGLGIIFGAGLAFASKIFQIKEDPLKQKILEILPGANCGACGLAGCESYAQWLSEDKTAPPDKCTVGGIETAKKIGAIFGVDVSNIERKVAVVKCNGGENCTNKFIYEGIQTCYAANILFGGYKSCSYGCLGLGDCVRACHFGAISFKDGNKIPVVNYSKCTGCGLCVKACPKKIIELISEKYLVHIQCKSQDKGAVVRKICKTGCIGCGVCVKTCPKNDIVLENNLARIKYENCDNCGLCIEKCPTKSINRVITETSQEKVAIS